VPDLGFGKECVMQRSYFSPIVRIISILVLPLVYVALCPDLADAQDDPGARYTLKGLPFVGVRVGLSGDDISRGGVTQDQLQTDVELRLRKAGIKVVADAPWYLSVLVSTSHITSGPATVGYAYNVSVGFVQGSYLFRDSRIPSFAPTWSIWVVSWVREDWLQNIRAVVGDTVDRFINAYLEQNPKP